MFEEELNEAERKIAVKHSILTIVFMIMAYGIGIKVLHLKPTTDFIFSIFWSFLMAGIVLGAFEAKRCAKKMKEDYRHRFDNKRQK